MRRIFLLNMATLVFLRQRFILPSEAALEAVSETVAAHGEILPTRAAPGYIAGAVNSLLSRYRLEAEEEKRSIRESAERRLREISESQKNLLSHHRLTKKMLQSRQADEVFEILLGGIAEGYGFPGSLIGKVSADGYLVFQGETDPVSGSPLRIPLWHPGSLLARTFWSGNLLHASPRELPHLPEEESILGSSPVLCLPVMRNLKVRCVEAKNCVGPDLLQLLFREPEVLVEEYSAGVLHRRRETPRSIAKRSSPVSDAKSSRPPPCWSSGASRTGRC